MAAYFLIISVLLISLFPLTAEPQPPLSDPKITTPNAHPRRAPDVSYDPIHLEPGPVIPRTTQHLKATFTAYTQTTPLLLKLECYKPAQPQKVLYSSLSHAFIPPYDPGLDTFEVPFTIILNIANTPPRNAAWRMGNQRLPQ